MQSCCGGGRGETSMVLSNCEPYKTQGQPATNAVVVTSMGVTSGSRTVFVNLLHRKEHTPS